ncbi:MAG: pseudouridine synthase [Neisseriaceae bacterium]
MSRATVIAFNKPYGVVCQFSPHEKYSCLKDFINAKGFYPAGRLDADSEGLVLLTQNGLLQHRISHPTHKQEKTYFVQLEGIPDPGRLKLLEEGVQLKHYHTQAAKIRFLQKREKEWIWERNPPIRWRRTVPDFWIAICISEGKNRQIRKMTAHVGYPCLRLIRTQIGSLNLFDLKLAIGESCNLLWQC